MQIDAVMQGAQHRYRWLVVPPLVLLPFLLGGARPWFWSFVAALFLITAVGFIWLEKHSPSLAHGAWYRNRWCFLLGAMVAYPLLQILPLPSSLLAVMSPQRLHWLQRAGEIAPSPSLAGVSYDPLTTFFSWLWWIFLAGYVLALRKFFLDEKELGKFFLILFFFAGFEALYGLLQALIPSLGVLLEPGSANRGLARGTFVNRNHFAAFLGMIWPLLLAYSLTLSRASAAKTPLSFREKERDRENRQKQMFLGFIVGLVLLAVFFSMSRGGIISALISLTVFVTLGRTRQKGTLAFVAMSWMIMIGYGAIIGFDQIMLRFDRMESDVPGRFQIWKEAWQIILDHPLMGTGLGSFPSVGALHQVHLPDTIHTSHVHNDYLELISDLGIPVGGGMIVLVWGYWWRTAWRVWRMDQGADYKEGKGERREKQRLLAVGALAGSAAFLAHGWVEFNWQIPANQLYFLMLLVLMKDR